MPDSTTTTPSGSSLTPSGTPKTKDLQAENDRLRGLLEAQGVDPDEALDPNRGIVGNYADIQRLGALAVSDSPTKVEDAIVPFKPEPPADVDLAASDQKPDHAKDQKPDRTTER